MLTTEEIKSNWEKLREIINDTFTGERLVALNTMYDALEEDAVIAPASSIDYFHNAFPGGYVEHVLRVMELSLGAYELMEKFGSEFDYSKETLLFCALNHDLGKVGNGEHPTYEPNPSEWHREHQGKIYEVSGKIRNMTVADRTFFLLQKYKVEYTELEFLGIKCTDGMYEESNAAYLKQFMKDRQIIGNLHIVLHAADNMACSIEKQRWEREKQGTPTTKKSDEGVVMHKKQNIGKIAEIVNKTPATGQALFDSLFDK